MTIREEGYAEGYRDGYYKRDGEIVRCKDCLFKNNTGISSQWLPCMDTTYPDSFFCGRGERKDGDDEE